jgi:hypothetical protein
MIKIFQMSLNKCCIILLVCISFNFQIKAQEAVVPLLNNFNLDNSPSNYGTQKQRATLPFFDDFSYNASTPNPALWEENQVFINNTMGINVLTQGVATFDGLNEQGRPYKPNNFNAVGYGDSLTCTPINLSFRTPADSINLSFWVQPQGNGFAPETNDSLFLFFRNSTNNWVQVWRQMGSTTLDFEQNFVKVIDPQFLHDSFQFRFVNFTSLNLNDDVWNLDYVEMDVNRSSNDTTANDIAFTTPPTSILNTYTAMPFRHFLTTDLSTQQDIAVRNIYDVSNTFTVRHTAEETVGSTTISSNALAPFNAFAKSVANLANPSFALGLSGAGPFSVRNTYTIDPINLTDFKGNDTIVSEAVFDNYFAYDDGSSELAYFLIGALNQPTKTAMRFELRQADTVYGLGVHFAAQVPSAAGKFFSIVLYDSLGATSPGDIILHQQDLYQVQYPTVRGEFSTYAFDTPIGLGPGRYYIGITQPANFGSDSIYYGLDVNNDNNIQQLSYNVNGFWFNSSVTGTVMIRPMVGSSFIPTDIDEVSSTETSVIYPNPSSNIFRISGSQKWNEAEILSVSGQILKRENIVNNSVHLDEFPSGTYFIKLINSKHSETHKVCKQ